MKKILVVGDFISGSGLTKVVMDIFKNFPSTKYQIEAVGYGEDPTGYVDRQCQQLGWKIVRVVPVTKNPLKHWQWWKDWFKIHHYDIAYFNYSSSWNYLPVVDARRYGHVKQIVCHSHNSYFSHTFGNPLLMRMLVGLNNHGRKIFDRFADTKVATSQEAAAWMFGQAQVKNTYVSINGVDIPNYMYSQQYRTKIRQKLNIKEHTKLIGFVGVLQDRKNPLFALKVFSQYHQKNHDSKLVMLGKGPLKKEIDSEIKRLGLTNDVIQIDFVPNPNEWYSAMDALLFTSKHEGLALVAIEAQVNNLPILAADTNVDAIFASDCIHQMKGFQANIWCEQLTMLLNAHIDRDHFEEQLDRFSIKHQAAGIEKLLD